MSPGKLVIFLLWLLYAVGARAELQAGAARVDITPDVTQWSVPLGGYADRKAEPANAIQDRVFARALMLESRGERVALVAVDLCFVPANLTATVLQRARDAGVAGLHAGNLFLAATHTHSAPDPLAMHQGNNLTLKRWPSFDARLLDFTASRITEALVQATQRMRPARAGSAAVPAVELNRNRRGDPTTDTALTVLKVTTTTGATLATVVNFAAHPTLDDRGRHISADWPGVLCAELERTAGAGAICLFMNGAEGDTSPQGAEGNAPRERIMTYGRKVAERAQALLARVQTQSDIVVQGWTQRVNLPPRRPNGLFFLAAAQLGISPDQAKQLVHQLMPEHTHVHFARIGDLLLIGLPCEPTGALGLQVKARAQQAGWHTPVVVALTNDWLGYALLPEQYRAGGYEASMSFFGERLGPVLLDAVSAGLPSRPRLPAHRKSDDREEGLAHKGRRDASAGEYLLMEPTQIKATAQASLRVLLQSQQRTIPHDRRDGASWFQQAVVDHSAGQIRRNSRFHLQERTRLFQRDLPGVYLHINQHNAGMTEPAVEVQQTRRICHGRIGAGHHLPGVDRPPLRSKGRSSEVSAEAGRMLHGESGLQMLARIGQVQR